MGEAPGLTIRDALQEGQRRLSHAHPHARVETPLLDASVLLAEALGTTREGVYTRLPDSLDPISQSRFTRYLEKRLGGVPVSYICGRKEFYGLTFRVGPQVLVPRPDTETLVDAALEIAPRGANLHDVCTGSGCVAIAIQRERPDLHVSASDVSPEVESIFRENCRRNLSRDLPFAITDLLEDTGGPFDLITANPPYLTDPVVRAMENEGWPEPVLALAGGADGLDVVRRLVARTPDYLLPGGSLLLEADPDQMDRIVWLMRERGFSRQEIIPDLAGRGRVVKGWWEG